MGGQHFCIPIFFSQELFGEKGKEMLLMTTFEALVIMISFSVLIVSVIALSQKK